MELWNRKKRSRSLDNVSKWARKGRYYFTKTLKSQVLLMTFSVVVVLIVMIGSSYAVFSSLNGSNDYNTLTVGTLDINYDDTSSGYGDALNLSNEYPISDTAGLASTGYKFSITNTGSLSQFYSIRVAVDEAMVQADNCANNLVDFNNLKISVNDETPIVLGSLQNFNYVVATGTLDAGIKKDFNIKMWIKSDAGNDVLGKHFHGKVVVEAENTTAEDKTNYLVYDTTGTTAIVTGVMSSGLDLSRIDIPSKYNNFVVDSINATAFASCSNLKLLNIPATITKISANTFVNCTNLTDVYINNTADKVTIEDGAFLNTTNIHYTS